MAKRQVAALAAAGVVFATMAGVTAFLVSGATNEQPARDTVPVGQLVDAPTSIAPSSSAESPVVVADPNLKDTAVAEAPQPAPQTAQAPPQQPPADNGPVDDPPAEPTFTHPPYEPTGPGDTAPAPPPPAPCYVDENGHDICP